MRYASVVVDIATRALDGAFDYAIPSELEESACVGSTVLVTFSGRMAVGYIVAVSDEAPAGIDPARIRPIERVLAESAFDEGAAELAGWISREYAAALPEALRLFIAPGQTVKVARDDEGGPWQLVCDRASAVDDRWASLGPEAASFVPSERAVRQKAVVEALSQGPVRISELNAMLGSVASAIKSLEAKGVVEVSHRRRVRGSEATTLSSAKAARPEKLTDGQKAALAAIDEACSRASGDVVLIDGVTGSGKTEVYLEAIERVREQGRGALVLVPEISLTAQTVGRFRSRFGDDVAVLHSRLSAGERFDQWDMVRTGQAHVVVGARSALFAPLRDVGLIIIDEEHEGSYKQDQQPRYHARETACELARIRGCALVLGSATPSLESLARSHKGSFRGASWTCVEMPERPGAALLPQVRVVDMTDQFARGGRSIFSEALRDALADVVSKREKAVLLLNRRGFANFLMCRECGCVPECPHCSTALTYHERTHELMCHTCGSSWPMRSYPDPATKCPNCGSRYLGQYGVGTQRVEDELRVLIGDGAKIIRMDADTTKGKGDHQRLLEEFDAAECAILIGTQMIAKGLDFPEVTLVGVINADTTLKLPDFRAAERTHDLLEQVAGRAGRGEVPGKVIIQSYWASHPAIRSVAEHDREIFLNAELADRYEAGNPPYGRLANVTVWGKNKALVAAQVEDMARAIREKIEGVEGWRVLGPADCVKARVKDRIRKHIVVKGPVDADMGALLSSCAAGLPKRVGVSMALDVDAYDMM